MSAGLLIRLREVELRLASELAAAGFLLATLMTVLPHGRGVKLPLAVVLGSTMLWSFARRWRVRTTKRNRMLEWHREPLCFDGSVVIQENERGERLGVIDPKQHYTVTWERFGSDRVLYSVTQNTHSISISTLALNATLILRDVLGVANYQPCEEWPNLDL